MDQIEDEAAPDPAVAPFVQPAHRLDRLCEDTLSSLSVRGPAIDGRQGEHDLDAVIRVKVDKVPVCAIHEEQSVRPHEHALLGSCASFDEPSEMGMELGASPGDVDGFYGTSVENVETLLHGLPRHGFCPFRAAIHMAMPASYVAAVSRVDLKNAYAFRHEPLCDSLGKGGLYIEAIHLSTSPSCR